MLASAFRKFRVLLATLFATALVVTAGSPAGAQGSTDAWEHDDGGSHSCGGSLYVQTYTFAGGSILFTNKRSGETRRQSRWPGGGGPVQTYTYFSGWQNIDSWAVDAQVLNQSETGVRCENPFG